MTDVHTAAQRSFNMSRIRGVNTKPELRVRRLLHSMGFRYRLHAAGLAGKPDLVFRSARAVLFVHGCFWHMHRCRLGKPVPATNADFWANKRRSNAERDQRNRRALRKAGWQVFEVWECQTRDALRIERALAPLVTHLNKQRG
jgi:DNA mismatch endonuclease (patch repair protein)